MKNLATTIIGLVALFFLNVATALPITACFDEGTCLKLDDTIVLSDPAFISFGDPIKLSGPDNLIGYANSLASTVLYPDSLQVYLGSNDTLGNYDYLIFAVNEPSLDYGLSLFDLLQDAQGLDFIKIRSSNTGPIETFEYFTLNKVIHGDLPPTSVPEPGALALMSLGLLGLGLARRKKIKNTKAL